MADNWLWLTGRDFIDCYYDRLTLLSGYGFLTDRVAIGYRIWLMLLPSGMETTECP